jgi:putative ABC transport system ATP-binding protein
MSQDILRQEASTLSGGEAQLIHLLRSLQFDPRVLFLDEPTSSLDPSRTEKLENFLNDWVQESSRSLVMITHQKDQSRRFASKVVNFENGGLSAARSP